MDHARGAAYLFLYFTLTTEILIMRYTALAAMATLIPAGAMADQDALLDRVVAEKPGMRLETAKFFALEDSTYMGVYYQEPIHRLEEGVWVDMTEAERNALAPSGKVAQWTGFEGNGGCVRKRADGTYTWFNNFRRLYKWSTTNDTYRTVLSFWTPVPDDKILLLHAELWLYQKNPFNTICGAQVRLMANQVESQPENVWNWIGGGDLIREDWQIARPDYWVWQNNGCSLVFTQPCGRFGA